MARLRTRIHMVGDVDNSLNIPRGSFGVYWYDRGQQLRKTMERAASPTIKKPETLNRSVT
jgi:hypothetical protein